MFLTRFLGEMSEEQLEREKKFVANKNIEVDQSTGEVCYKFDGNKLTAEQILAAFIKKMHERISSDEQYDKEEHQPTFFVVPAYTS